MKGIDKLFRANVEKWLSKKEHTKEELADGAMMVLQCTRNRTLYNTIMRRPERFEEKIAYELRKHLRYLKDDLNIDEVRNLERKILPVIDRAETVALTEKKPLPSPAYSSEKPYNQTDTIVARGKRPDHDTLPEEIKAIWEKNAERWKKMKQAHETCKTLTAACDRYEYVKVITEAWETYKKDFATYDHYRLPAEEGDSRSDSTSEGKVQLSVEDLNAINAARPYISKNLPKLLDLVAAAKKEGFTDDQAKKLEEWREKIQQRVDVLIRTKQVIKDELRQKLTEADIKLEISDSDEQGQEHSDDSPATE